MKGYLYKEWKQNRILFLLTVIVAICVAFMPILLVMAWKNTITKEVFLVYYYKGILFQILCVALGFMGTLGMQDLTLRDDDRRSWGYFVASNPKGIKGYILAKYVMIALLSVVFFTVSAVCDFIFTLIAKNAGGIDIPTITETLAYLMMIQLLIQAIEIPFSIRFGVKKGNTIKNILFLSIIVIFILIFVLNPEGVADFCSIIETDWKLPDWGEWLLPVASVIVYIVSGMLSCKLYLKGVHQSYR